MHLVSVVTGHLIKDVKLVHDKTKANLYNQIEEQTDIHPQTPLPATRDPYIGTTYPPTRTRTKTSSRYY